ncbi:hypothetical protein HWQ46_18225 [Shewanella sp. D64]|uniref:hypothetical protein n=1 Tax=unclassified Shewanella TaxID=196818 RepID=UPI0022BA3F24|nr:MULTISPECIES: hypothetical protein [unclassified Shewanella]MEC4727485.1 hypothetical protein [Shewanella sp. D64]MEC4738106.1 hypothetical protein [Shewanella sp. E94]WBJ96380.1 hypothetical protein HWQ47_04445 [Shewanella sp. MTB7]
MEFSRILTFPTTILISVVSFNVSALDWRIAFGGHDFIVEQESSHTFGVDVNFSFAHLTESNILLTGYIDVLVDHDKDKLDPDHIPIWFMSNYMAKGELFTLSLNSTLMWEVELDGKRNTVSSVEKQVKLFPAISYEYSTEAFFVAVKGAAGYYFLEIDDDVPRLRGYDREDFQNKTGAYSFAANTRVALGEVIDLSLSAQHWNDGDEWLENQYGITLIYDSHSWVKDSYLILSVEYTEYNLEPYAKMSVDDPGYLAILPWNNDTLVRLYIDMPWDF